MAMFRSKASFLWVYCFLVGAIFLGRATGQTGDFSIIVLPDMQQATQFYLQVEAAQAQWIAQRKMDMNIVAVLGEGDIVNDGSDDAQWSNADAAFKLLDQAEIPYFLAIGNHDYDGANAGVNTRSAAGFNQWFGPLRYSGRTWFRGTYSGGAENSYGVINVNGADILVLVLEFVPRDEVVSWGASVLAANADKPALLLTHSYMYMDNTRLDQCDNKDLLSQNYGDKLWAKLVSQSPNVQMVFSGHITSGQGARRADLGAQGELVNQMFANYQTLAYGGSGYLRILSFHPLTNTVDVKTYSPYLNTYMTDAGNQFTLAWHAPAATGTTGTVSGLVRDSKTCGRIAGAVVKIGTTAATTDMNGHYSIALPAGSYTAGATANAYAPASQSAVVNRGYDADTNFYLASTAPCPLNPASPSVTICAPANAAYVTSPVQVTAGATDTNTVSFVQLYIDGVSKVTQKGAVLNTSAALPAGSHRLTVLAKDATGLSFKQTINVTVGTAPPSTCASGATIPSVTICSPAPNATVTSPVPIAATAVATRSISTMELWVDGLKARQQYGPALNANVAMSAGTHRVTVVAVDSAKTTYKQTIYITAFR
jgi:Big-like domain-containing protein/carboxypeptidase family protein/calcineurin-like phosphoesterase family protein